MFKLVDVNYTFAHRYHSLGPIMAEYTFHYSWCSATHKPHSTRITKIYYMAGRHQS